MSIPDDGLVGRSFDAALDQIMLLPNAEEQAQALLHHSELLTTPRANVLMKKIAAPTTPGRKKLYDVLVAREAERARNKAAPTRRKGRGKGEGIIMPDLFVAFGAAPLSEEAKNIEAAPPPVETKDIDAESPPENIGEGTHGPT